MWKALRVSQAVRTVSLLTERKRRTRSMAVCLKSRNLGTDQVAHLSFPSLLRDWWDVWLHSVSALHYVAVGFRCWERWGVLVGMILMPVYCWSLQATHTLLKLHSPLPPFSRLLIFYFPLKASQPPILSRKRYSRRCRSRNIVFLVLLLVELLESHSTWICSWSPEVLWCHSGSLVHLGLRSETSQWILCLNVEALWRLV